MTQYRTNEMVMLMGSCVGHVDVIVVSMLLS